MKELEKQLLDKRNKLIKELKRNNLSTEIVILISGHIIGLNESLKIVNDYSEVSESSRLIV